MNILEQFNMVADCFKTPTLDAFRARQEEEEKELVNEANRLSQPND